MENKLGIKINTEYYEWDKNKRLSALRADCFWRVAPKIQSYKLLGGCSRRPFYQTRHPPAHSPLGGVC